MHRLICWSFLILGILPLKAQGYLVQKEFLSVEDGLSNRFVYSAVQDDLGFMWFGTRYGLNRYDGYTFRTFTAEEHNIQSNLISELHKDAQGLIWVGMQQALNQWHELSNVDILHPDSLVFHSFQGFFGAEAPFSESAIRQISSKEGEILLTTHQEQLYRYRAERGFELLFDIAAVDSVRIKQVFKNELGYWLFVDNQILLLDVEQPRLDTLVRDSVHLMARIARQDAIAYQKVGDFETSIEVTPNGSRSIPLRAIEKPSSVDNALLRSDRFRDLFLLLTRGYFQLSDSAGNSLTELQSPYTYLRDYYLDKDGNIWLVYDGGIQKISLKKARFQYTVRGVSTRYIGALSEELLFISAFNKEAFKIEANSLDSLEKVPRNLIIDAIPADKKHIWAVNSSKGMEYYDWEQQKSIFYPLHKSIKDIWYLLPDDEQGLWLATIEGLAYFNQQTQTSKPILFAAPFDRLNQSIIYHIQPQGEHLWLASSSGLYLMDAKGNILDSYAAHESAKHPLPHSYIHHIHIDSAGLLWLATRGGGLIRLNPKTHAYKQYTKQQGLSHDLLYAILEDDFGKLWISSNYGLMRFDKSEETVNVYLQDDGLLNEEFNLRSFYKHKDGHLFFGGINGAIHFHPKDFLKDTIYAPPLRVIRFQQFDGEQQAVVDRTIALQNNQKITLAPNDAFFILDLALLDYTQSKYHGFAYRIEGWDNNWNYLIGNQLRINRLPAGNYQLHIKARGENGRWSQQVLSLTLDVQEVFYRRAIFWVLIILGLLLLLLLYWRWRVVRFRKRQQELENQVEKRTAQIRQDKKTIEAQAAALKELDNLKSRFFTNISHELRTPLTLMLGPVAAIQREQYGRDFERIRQVLNVIKENGENLQELIDEILDLSKLEANKLQLEERPLALRAFLETLFQQFELQTNLQGIVFSLSYEVPEDLVLLVDSKKLEKILRNLLSNALKFTPKGEQIEIKAYSKGTTWYLQVIDTGEGIHPRDMPHIFQRFYQSRQKEAHLQGGSGIGLALSYELAKLMGGQLTVQSTWKQGSIFTLQLPLQESTQKAAAISRVSQSSLPKLDDIPTKNKQHLLIVEDNGQLRQFLSDLLMGSYRITAVDNGAKAWALVEQGYDIDLILSDVMMPQMDGFELLRKVKAKCNIPVVLLTARAAKADQIEALRIGVDDYLTKPFEQQELLLRINRLLTNRQNRLQAQQQEAISNEVDSRSDSYWVERIERILRREVGNEQFGIQDLAERMHLSERQLRRRLKEQIGLSPNKYFISVRLQVARELLETGQYHNLQDIAAEVGYTNAHYFARKYEENFGHSPESYFN